MKKTISINLQGIVFYIEEDGYDLLQQYLSSVKRYFAPYAGHEEIVADIESRMAEIFLTRLSGVKQAITLEEVQALIRQLGTVEDMAASAEAEDLLDETYAGAAGGAATAAAAAEPTAQKRLYRDVHRKMLGGVAAGIANYLNVDPVWIRLVFILLVLGTPFFDFGGFAGFSVLSYIVLWLVLPVSNTLPETKVKKFYRNPDDKKIGGVASGLAAYFGTDATWIRLLFVVLIFIGGFGIIAYLVLWLIMPEATTITERMEMRGNPITLSNIEENIRTNPNFRDGQGEPTPFAKVLLVLAQMVQAVVLFVLGFARILGGLLLLVLALALMIGAFTLLGGAIGILAEGRGMELDGLPVSMIRQDLPWYGVISGFLTMVIPAVFLAVLGVSLLAKRFLMNQAIGWSLLGLWLVSAAVTVAAGVQVSQKFREEATYTNDQKFAYPAAGVLTLRSVPTGKNGYEQVDITLESHKGPDVLLISEYEARGRDMEDAIRNAQMVNYPIKLQDSVLTLPTSFGFKPNTSFRGQDLEVRLLLPENRPFRLDRNLLQRADFATSFEGISTSALADKLLQFEGGKLRCLTCTKEDSLAFERNRSTHSFEHHYEGEEDDLDINIDFGGADFALDIPEDGPSRSFTVRDFSSVEASSAIRVLIRKGTAHKVTAYGEKDVLNDLEVEVRGNELELRMDRPFIKFFDYKPALVVIETPELAGIDFNGAIKSEISGFESSRFKAELSGASRALLDITCDRLETDLTGAVNLQLRGRTDYLNADLTGASKLQAEDFAASSADIDASGACKVWVNVSNRLKVDATGASKIYYTGKPQKIIEDLSGASRLEER